MHSTLNKCEKEGTEGKYRKLWHWMNELMQNDYFYLKTKWWGFFFFRQIKACFFVEWVIYAIVEATVYREEGENFISWSLPPWTVLMIFSFSAWSRSWRSRASWVLDLQASAWSTRSFLGAWSAFSLWICSMRICLVLNTLPFTFRYRLWYMWRSIFLDARYRLSSRRRILLLLIQVTFSASSRRMDSHRLLVISPSLISFRICWRELALVISLVSLGSNQTFVLPQRRTLEASLFWSLSVLVATATEAKNNEEF